MDISEVIALSKAGFTSDQIMQMAQAQTFQQPQPQPQPIQQPIMMPQQMPQQMPQLVQVPATAPTPAPAPQPEQQKDPFQQLFEQMTGIKQAIQTSNIQNSQMVPAAPQTTDDILASIIQPTKPKEEK